jgi:hypothetical protein
MEFKNDTTNKSSDKDDDNDQTTDRFDNILSPHAENNENKQTRTTSGMVSELGHLAVRGTPAAAAAAVAPFLAFGTVVLLGSTPLLIPSPSSPSKHRTLNLCADCTCYHHHHRRRRRSRRVKIRRVRIRKKVTAERHYTHKPGRERERETVYMNDNTPLMLMLSPPWPLLQLLPPRPRRPRRLLLLPPPPPPLRRQRWGLLPPQRLRLRLR